MHSSRNRSSRCLLLAATAIGILIAPGIGAGVALAEGFDSENFRPAVSSTGYFSQDSGRILSPGGLSAGLSLGYALRPLVLRDAAGTDRVKDVVTNRIGSYLGAAYGIGGRLELGLRVPVILFQDGASTAFTPGKLAGTTFGDIDVSAKVGLIGRTQDRGFRLALAASFALPSGAATAFTGDETVAMRPRLIAGYERNRVSVAANAGYSMRHRTSAPGLFVDDEVAAGLGASYAALPDKLWIQAEAFLAASLDSGGAGVRAVPTEALLGARYLIVDRWFVQAGAGTGVTKGYGSPRFRAVVQVGFASDLVTPRPPPPPPPPPSPPADTDGDGILDPLDACPTDPEDKDGFEDEDGCPDTDNDKDGILDAADKCPMDPEDKDGFEDEDGCPDTDNDKDGILDAADKCPMDPEDKDGFEDEDGCPDTDNDNDGFPDVSDKCPNEAEVVNGNQDDDGCPDEGLVVLTREKVEIKEQVHFDFNKARIKRVSYALLEAVAHIVALHPELTKIRIDGHTDDVGSDRFNQKLSEMRATSVLNHLVKINKIDRARLEAIGYGRTRPLSDLKTDEARAANRRVEFVIVERDDTKVLGQPAAPPAATIGPPKE